MPKTRIVCTIGPPSNSEGPVEMIENAAESALKTDFVKSGDLVVITAGRPIYAAGTTNMLWVRRL